MSGLTEHTCQARAGALIRRDPFRMQCLREVRSLSLPDCYIAAGFLRNAIWDALHNYPQATPLNDIDVVYFNNNDLTDTHDKQLQAALSAAMSGPEWEVKNQARMHCRHDHPPYQNTTDAISHWIEVPTCVGVRLESDDSLTFSAPYGLRHNFSNKVDINPRNRRETLYRQRMHRKNWQQLWPQLQFSTFS